jgi:4a-hydroxytetrahydrobiopterin dehydratase
MSGRRFEVCVDANDPARLREFWRVALGYVDEKTGEGAVDLVDPGGVGPTLWFQQVPESKTAKNRLHLDIRVEPDELQSVVDALVKLNGTVVAVYQRFTTLTDPEGNELCITAH